MGKPHNVKIKVPKSLPLEASAFAEEFGMVESDARYMCHAANSYPRLVEVMKYYATRDVNYEAAAALLKELGE